MPSSRGSSQPRDQTYLSYVSCIGRWAFLPLAPPGKPCRDNAHSLPNLPLVMDAWHYIFQIKEKPKQVSKKALNQLPPVFRAVSVGRPSGEDSECEHPAPSMVGHRSPQDGPPRVHPSWQAWHQSQVSNGRSVIP